MDHYMKKGRAISVALALLGLAALTGCETLKQLAQMQTFTKCDFRLASVTGTNLAGIPLEGKTRVSDIDPLDMIKLGVAFNNGTLPLQFTANIEVRNPNPSAAAMNKLAWILYLDDNEMASGLLSQRVEIPANGGTGAFPLAVSVDLLKALSGKALNSVLNAALNVAGEGNQPTRVTLKAKPSILIDGQSMDFPGYVTVTATYSSQETGALRQDILQRLDQSLKSN